MYFVSVETCEVDTFSILWQKTSISRSFSLRKERRREAEGYTFLLEIDSIFFSSQVSTPLVRQLNWGMDWGNHQSALWASSASNLTGFV